MSIWRRRLAANPSTPRFGPLLGGERPIGARHAVVEQHHVVLDQPQPRGFRVPARAGGILLALQRLALFDVRAGAVEARLFVVPENETDGPVGPDVRGGEDAGELHYERGTGAVVIRRLTPPVPVHVGAHDVHLPGMTAADLGAIHFFARARSRGLRVQCAHPAVGLPLGIGVDPGGGASAAVTASTRGGPPPPSPPPFGGGGARRLCLGPW